MFLITPAFFKILAQGESMNGNLLVSGYSKFNNSAELKSDFKIHTNTRNNRGLIFLSDGQISQNSSVFDWLNHQLTRNILLVFDYYSSSNLYVVNRVCVGITDTMQLLLLLGVSSLVRCQNNATECGDGLGAGDSFFKLKKKEKECTRLSSVSNFDLDITAKREHRLAVEGSIETREIKVKSSSWADFVFYANYQLPNLYAV